MSLVAFAVRLATVRAISAAVWPEFTVANGPQRPLDTVAAGSPVVAVYTSGSNDGLEGNELLAGDPRVSLSIQIYLPPVVTVTIAGAPLEFDTRADGAETMLDVLARRILAALVAEAEPWSQLWGRLVSRTRTIGNSSYLVESAEVRCAARELTLECETLYEPIPGAPPMGVWAELIALMRADSGASTVADLADWVAGEITGPQLLTQDQRDRIDLGLAAYASRSISVTPLVAGSETEIVAVTVTAQDGDIAVIPGPGAPPTGAPPA